MPRWEFSCPHCGESIELSFPSYEDSVRQEPIKCYVCGTAMNRLPSAPSFKLIGSGFHANDYKTTK